MLSPNMVRASLAVAALMSTSLIWAQGPDQANMDARGLYNYAGSLMGAGDQKGAISAYEALVQRFQDDGAYAAFALYRLSGLYYQANRLTDAEAAALRIIKDYPASNSCKMGQPAFYLSAIYLYKQDKPQAVLDLMSSYCDNYAPDLHTIEWSTFLVRVSLAHLKLGDAKAAGQFLADRLPQCICLLSNPEYFETLAQIATAQKDTAGALAAAREGYAFCNFDEATIKRMADLVRRTFMATGDVSKGLQFLASQDDPSAPNPLKEVPVPKISEQQKNDLLKGVGDNPALRSLALLYVGDYAKALSESLLYVAQAPASDAVKSLMTVARVFKAADLGIHRANRFIEFARTGKGENPCNNAEF